MSDVYFTRRIPNTFEFNILDERKPEFSPNHFSFREHHISVGVSDFFKCIMVILRHIDLRGKLTNLL
jgi:hypothetical protein